MLPVYEALGASKALTILFPLLTILLFASISTGNASPPPIEVNANVFWPIQPDGMNSIDHTSSSLCTNPPRGQCNFYADCLESMYKCGPNGYPIGYGQHFCERLDANRTEFSTQGQTWLFDAQLCLQRTLVPEATSTAGMTCDSLKKKAFASHGPCYVQSGLCTLPYSDWITLVKIVGVKELVSSEESFLATLSAAEGCLKAYLYFLQESL